MDSNTRLEEAARQPVEDAAISYVSKFVDAGRIETFKAGAEWQAKELAGGWISVNDRLPEVSTTDGWRNTSLQSNDVLVWESERIWFGYYSSKHGGSWIVPGRMGGIEVTHWQPLPRKPLV